MMMIHGPTYYLIIVYFHIFSPLSGIWTPHFQRPPQRRELPCPKLLRKAFLIAETDSIEDYRTQIMSTFGKVLKYDSTKKVYLTHCC